MKIGLNLWVWESPFRTDRHLPLLQKIRELGGEVVEFALEEDGMIEAPILRRALTHEGLGCSVLGLFGPERDLASLLPSQRTSGIEYARESLELCAEAGVSLFSAACVGVGGTQAVADRERIERFKFAAEALHRIGDFAAQVGVSFCVEVLNRYEDNLLNISAQACELMDLTGHETVGIHLDTFHMNMEEVSMGDAIRLAGKKLFHFHASDTHRGAPGGGHLQWDEVVKAFKDIPYEGFVVIESFNPAGRLVPMARAWHPYAESQDLLVKQGFAFLKKTFQS